MVNGDVDVDDAKKNLLDIFLKLHPARRLLPLPVIAFNLPRSHHDWHCGNDRDNCFDDINLISLSSQKRGWGSWTPSAISPKISLPAMFKICFPAISKNLPPRNVWKSPSNKNIQKAVRDPASYRFFTRNPNQVPDMGKIPTFSCFFIWGASLTCFDLILKLYWLTFTFLYLVFIWTKRS